ncbi:GAF domain-containing protein [Achromobacter sp.]|uniref:GAF domain-containing protein n=1 Tax=Achromobacter sp. TaxID=134375 RepID=UPI002F9225EE
MPTSASSLLSLNAFARSLAQSGQPARGLNVLGEALQECIGYRLFTVLVLDWEAGLSRRYFSTQPATYPAGGSKPIREDSEFYAAVVQQGEPRLCLDREDCVRAFPDHELIASLGCESAVNVPVRWNGRTLGSLNLLHQAGWYRRDMFPELAWYSALAIPVVQDIIRTTQNHEGKS